VTEDGITIDVRPVQLANALSLILVTEDGITIDVRPVQYSNTLSLILVTEDVPENVTEIRPVQLRNA
jgi:hypothetical protein